MIVMNSGSQLSELLSVSQMSQVSMTVFSIVKIASVSKLSNFIENFQKLWEKCKNYIRIIKKC